MSARLCIDVESQSNENITFLLTIEGAYMQRGISQSRTVAVGPLTFYLELRRAEITMPAGILLLLYPIAPDRFEILNCTVAVRSVKGMFSAPTRKSFDHLVKGSPVMLYSIHEVHYETVAIGHALVLRITITIPRDKDNTVVHVCDQDDDGLKYDRSAEHSLGRALERVVNTADCVLPMGLITIQTDRTGDNAIGNIHALTLAARSPVFRTMLTSSMQETTTREIHITDFSPETVAAFVRFLHTDRCSHADLQAHTPQLLQLADKYQVPALGAVCAQYIHGTLSCENALGVQKLADSCNAREVRQEALRFIVQHADGMCKDVGHLEDVSAELLRDILADFGASKKQQT